MVRIAQSWLGLGVLDLFDAGVEVLAVRLLLVARTLVVLDVLVVNVHGLFDLGPKSIVVSGPAKGQQSESIV